MELHVEPAIDGAVLEACRREVDAAAAQCQPVREQDSKAGQLLQSMLGFYQQQMAALGWSKTALVEFGKAALRGMGVPQVPAIDAGVARKLGLVGYGLELQSEEQSRANSRDEERREPRYDARREPRYDDRRGSPFRTPITHGRR